MVREQLPQDRKNRLVAGNHGPQRFEDQHLRAQQDVNQAHLALGMSGADRHGGVFGFAYLADLLYRRFPRPGFPHAVDVATFVVNQLSGGIPAERLQPVQNFGLEPGLHQRTLNKERVIVLFDIVVLHDVHKRPRVAVLPGAGQLFQQPFRRVMPVAAIAVFHPLFENQPALGMAGRGVGVVLVDLNAALIHAEIHTTGDHMVATPLPGEAQARPEDFRDVEKRQQAVVFQHLVRRVQVHQMQFVSGLDQLLLGAFGNGEVLAGIFVDHMAVGADIRLLQRVIFVKPFSVELTLVFQPRAADFQQFAVDFRLGNAVFRVVGLDHPAENLRVIEGVMDRVTPVLHAQTQLARPLLPERQRGVNHVLLRNSNLIVEKLGDHRDVASLVKLAALLPDQQRPGARRAF